jgi:hypothetical protein
VDIEVLPELRSSLNNPYWGTLLQGIRIISTSQLRKGYRSWLSQTLELRDPVSGFYEVGGGFRSPYEGNHAVRVCYIQKRIVASDDEKTMGYSSFCAHGKRCEMKPAGMLRDRIRESKTA